MFATPSKLVCSQLLHTYSLAGACWVDLYVYFDLLTQVGARETESDLQKRIRSMYSFLSVSLLRSLRVEEMIKGAAVKIMPFWLIKMNSALTCVRCSPRQQDSFLSIESPLKYLDYNGGTTAQRQN